VIGVSRRADAGELLNEQGSGLFGHWEPTDDAHGTSGVGVVLADGEFERFIEHSKQYLSQLTAHDGEPIVYYNGGAWDRAGKIKSGVDWFADPHGEQDKIDATLRVEIR